MTAPTLPEPRPDDEGRETVPDVIRRASDELARLCAGPGRLTHHRLAGRNWTMCVPVHHSDSDVIFGDLIEAAAKWHVASLTPHPAPLPAICSHGLAVLVTHVNDGVPCSDFLTRHPAPLGATDEGLREYRAAIQNYVAEVRRTWADHWQPKTGHRYATDFAAFLGERVLTDFDARPLSRAALQATP